MKTCSMCKIEKNEDEFYFLTKDKTKLHARCKECFKKKQYEYYDKVKDLVNLKYRSKYYEIAKKIKEYETN